jgi:RNA 3'-terminal phosphate cyclase (ATP)
MASLLGVPIAIHNVRAKLRKQGINPVDVAIARILGQATHADITAAIGDDLLLFAPTTPIKPFRDRIDLNAIAKGSQAGSAALIIQTLLTPFARAGGVSQITCRGGTHVPYSPTFDYLCKVTLPAFSKLGIYSSTHLHSAGYSPRGGGEVDAEIEPSVLSGFKWIARGKIRRAQAVVVTSELPDSVARRGATHLKQLSEEHHTPFEIEILRPRSSAPGAAVTFAVEFENGYGGTQALGQRGKPIEEVAGEAFFDFVHFLNSNTTSDAHLADQLLLPAVLSGEPCEYSVAIVTQTLLTTAWVIKQFMPVKMVIRGEAGEPGLITLG